MTTMPELTTPDDFIKFYEGIPEEDWCTEVYEDGFRCCAFGHLGERNDQWSNNGMRLFNLITTSISVNDGKNPRFPQPTPKARILAALREVKERMNKV